jgi:hypothetical protein
MMPAHVTRVRLATRCHTSVTPTSRYLTHSCKRTTQMRKAANRMNFDFNVAEDEYIDGDEVVGLGTINKEGSGRLRLVASQQQVRRQRAGVADAAWVAWWPCTCVWRAQQCAARAQAPGTLHTPTPEQTHTHTHNNNTTPTTTGQAECQAGEEVPQQAAGSGRRRVHGTRPQQHARVHTRAGVRVRRLGCWLCCRVPCRGPATHDGLHTPPPSPACLTP